MSEPNGSIDRKYPFSLHILFVKEATNTLGPSCAANRVGRAWEEGKDGLVFGCCIDKPEGQTVDGSI